MAFKKIGILGGMGPESSADFYLRIIHYFQQKYHAVQDTDFPPMVLYSLPLSGFDESGIVHKEEVFNQLINGVNVLSNAGCDFIVIPCNTVHLFINELRNKSTIPIISIMEETVKKIKQNINGAIGLLGSETTLKLGLYQDLLNKNGISCIYPKKNENPAITQLILEVMGGKVKAKTKSRVISIINRMGKKSAGSIILGCTEIPLAISQKDSHLKIYDTLQILAESAADFALNEHI